MLGKEIGGIFSHISNVLGNGHMEIFRYIGTFLGSSLGIVIDVIMFSNKAEVEFISYCYKKEIGDKQICECIYHKIDHYPVSKQIDKQTN